MKWVDALIFFKTNNDTRTYFIGNKVKARISKRVLQQNKAHQIFRKTNISYPMIRTQHPFWDSPFCLMNYIFDVTLVFMLTLNTFSSFLCVETYFSTARLYLHVQCQPLKQQSTVWNMFKVKNKNTRKKAMASFWVFLLVLKRFHIMFQSIHWWLWTSKYWLKHPSWQHIWQLY